MNRFASKRFRNATKCWAYSVRMGFEKNEPHCPKKSNKALIKVCDFVKKSGSYVLILRQL